MVSLKHHFVSGKADGADSTLVKPSEWDAEHDLVTAGDGVVLGRPAGAGAGPAQELPMSSVFQPGQVSIFAGATLPSGWLLCNGALLNRADYPSLFTAIGTAYNIGGEATTQFRVPDCRGRVIAMLDGGVGRINSYVPDVLGGAGGQQSENAGVNVSGNITVGVSVSGSLGGGADPSGQEVAAAASGSGASAVSHSHGVTVSGTLNGSGNGGNSMSGATNVVSNVQPTILMNMMIKT
jgi:microcystin-dependent protein